MSTSLGFCFKNTCFLGDDTKISVNDNSRDGKTISFYPLDHLPKPPIAIERSRENTVESVDISTVTLRTHTASIDPSESCVLPKPVCKLSNELCENMHIHILFNVLKW